MRLQPVRFIGHKIGPFDHVELNWHEDSQSTIIVGENGTGKTTLVAVMAACLGLGNYNAYPFNIFERFAHSQESFAYFELLVNGQKAFSLVWPHKAKWEDTQKARDAVNSDIQFTLIDEPSSPWENADKLHDYGLLSDDMVKLYTSWKSEENIETMAAAYGSYRDMVHDEVTEQKEITGSPFKDILNPFTGTQKSNVPQWIANQHVYHAVANTKGATADAESYLSVIRRIEEFFTEGLNLPIKTDIALGPFRLKVAQNGSQISIDQLSDGTRSFLSWTLDYLSRAERINWKDRADKGRAPGLILVDEIDSHLHPEWQKRVMSASADLLPHTHIIATTHSPFVVGSADDTQLFHIVKNDEGKLEVESSYDELYGQPADIILKELFTDSLYTPEIERDLERLSELMGKLTFGEISSEERQEHDKLFNELSAVSPWLSNLLAMTQASQNGS